MSLTLHAAADLPTAAVPQAQILCPHLVLHHRGVPRTTLYSERHRVVAVVPVASRTGRRYLHWIVRTRRTIAPDWGDKDVVSGRSRTENWQVPQRLGEVYWVAAVGEQDSNQEHCDTLLDTSYTEAGVEGSLRIVHSMAFASTVEDNSTK